MLNAMYLLVCPLEFGWKGTKINLYKTKGYDTHM